MAISLPEADNTPIAGATEEDEIGAVWPSVVIGFDPLVLLDPVSGEKLVVPFVVPPNQCLRVILQCHPYFHKRLKGV
jgi:hypothetical protein